jgi:hypothetical protein
VNSSGSSSSSELESNKPSKSSSLGGGGHLSTEGGGTGLRRAEWAGEYFAGEEKLLWAPGGFGVCGAWEEVLLCTGLNSTLFWRNFMAV